MLFIFDSSSTNPPWRWQCIDRACEKIRSTSNKTATGLSLQECYLICSDYAAIWPKPSGNVDISMELLNIDITKIEIKPYPDDTPISSLVKSMAGIFKEQIKDKISPLSNETTGYRVTVSLTIGDQNCTRLSLNTCENYTLSGQVIGDELQVNVTAATVFGARHGLETLTQIIIFDNIRNQLKIPSSFSIVDGPAYPYRSIMLDTGRNFLSVKTLKNTIKAMAASKLNTLHWHIADSQSFPLELKSLPELSFLGAYAPEKVYSSKDVSDLLTFAQTYGVRIIPEFDAPAHVGEGWQDTGLVICFDKPWRTYCSEPPCGQFDPTQPKLYDVLEGKK